MKMSALMLLLLLPLQQQLLPPPPKAASNRTAPARAKAIATPTIPVPDESHVMPHKATPNTQNERRRACAQFDHGNGAAAPPTAAVKQVAHSLGCRCPTNWWAPAAIHCFKAAAAHKNLLCYRMWAGSGVEGLQKASCTC